MIYFIIALPLLIIGALLTFLLLVDLPARGNLKLPKTIPLFILTTLTIGFGMHFLLLAVGA